MMKPLVIAVTCLTITGCSVFSVGNGDYACKGYDTEGVTCMSAREVYQATENTTSIKNSDFQNDDPQSDHMEDREAQRHPARSATDGQPTTHQHRVAGQYIQHTGPTPIRTPARVMRVWIDTYEDEQGDLHSPGLVYTEVQSRTWNIGKSVPKRAEKIMPLGLQSSNLNRLTKPLPQYENQKARPQTSSN